MEFSIKAIKQASENLQAEVVGYLQAHPDTNMADLEQELREGIQGLGAQILSDAIMSLEERYPVDEMACGCGEKASYIRKRVAKVISVFGRIEYQRNYYLCSGCHQGQFPLDRRLNLKAGEVSPGLASLLALAGAETAFEEGAALVERFTQVKVSDNTVRKETQRFGNLQAGREAYWKQQSEDEQALQERQRDVQQRPKRLYGSIDGVYVPLNEEWCELKICAWYEAESDPDRQDPQQHLRATNIHYYCDIQPAAEFSRLVWATACQHWADFAEEVVFIADGAAWIWKLVSYHFPHAIQIVDWYHAVSYLTPVAEAAFGLDSAEGQAWLENIRDKLWQGEIHTVIEACETWSTFEAALTAVTYFRNNASRMDYARFRELGYLIGSGVVESAAKQIGSFRLKRAGARWTNQGARFTAKARAAWLSGHWDQLSSIRARLPLAA
jgi:hypothetical protein